MKKQVSMTRLIRSSSPFTAALRIVPFLFLCGFQPLPESKTTGFRELDELAKSLKIEIVVEPRFPARITAGIIDGNAAEKKELQDYVPLFVQEFALHPKELIRRAKLQRVVLCRDLSFAKQLRNAIPDFENDILYLDVSRGSYNRNYLRTVIHHEFFHIIDYRDDGHLYDDKEWSSLNPATFKYGNGGKAAQGQATTWILSDQYPGFLNHYSTTGVEEDKAEVFAHMIVDHEFVAKQTKKDPVLQAKTERMKKLLSDFCPDMNDQFWQKVHKVKRDDR